MNTKATNVVDRLRKLHQQRVALENEIEIGLSGGTKKNVRNNIILSKQSKINYNFDQNNAYDREKNIKRENEEKTRNMKKQSEEVTNNKFSRKTKKQTDATKASNNQIDKFKMRRTNIQIAKEDKSDTKNPFSYARKNLIAVTEEEPKKVVNTRQTTKFNKSTSKHANNETIKSTMLVTKDASKAPSSNAQQKSIISSKAANQKKNMEINPVIERNANINPSNLRTRQSQAPLKRTIQESAIPSYDFKSRQVDVNNNFSSKPRNEQVTEAYSRYKPIVFGDDADGSYSSSDESDELIKQAAAFLKKARKPNLTFTSVQKDDSSSLTSTQESIFSDNSIDQNQNKNYIDQRNNTVIHAFPKKETAPPPTNKQNLPFSWGNMLQESINDTKMLINQGQPSLLKQNLNQDNDNSSKSKSYFDKGKAQHTQNQQLEEDDYIEQSYFNNRNYKKPTINSKHLWKDMIQNDDMDTKNNDNTHKKPKRSTGIPRYVPKKNLNKITSISKSKNVPENEEDDYQPRNNRYLIASLRRKANDILEEESSNEPDSSLYSDTNDIQSKFTQKAIKQTKPISYKIESESNSLSESEEDLQNKNLKQINSQSNVIRNPNSQVANTNKFSSKYNGKISNLAHNFNSKIDENEPTFEVTTKENDFSDNIQNKYLTNAIIKPKEKDSYDDNPSPFSITNDENSSKKAIADFKKLKEDILNSLKDDDDDNDESVQSNSSFISKNEESSDTSMKKSKFASKQVFNSFKRNTLGSSSDEEINPPHINQKSPPITEINQENNLSINSDSDDVPQPKRSSPKPEAKPLIPENESQSNDVEQVTHDINDFKVNFADNILQSSDTSTTINFEIENQYSEDEIPKPKLPIKPEPISIMKESKITHDQTNNYSTKNLTSNKPKSIFSDSDVEILEDTDNPQPLKSTEVIKENSTNSPISTKHNSSSGSPLRLSPPFTISHYKHIRKFENNEEESEESDGIIDKEFIERARYARSKISMLNEKKSQQNTQISTFSTFENSEESSFAASNNNSFQSTSLENPSSNLPKQLTSEMNESHSDLKTKKVDDDEPDDKDFSKISEIKTIQIDSKKQPQGYFPNNKLKNENKLLKDKQFSLNNSEEEEPPVEPYFLHSDSSVEGNDNDSNDLLKKPQSIIDQSPDVISKSFSNKDNLNEDFNISYKYNKDNNNSSENEEEFIISSYSNQNPNNISVSPPHTRNNIPSKENKNSHDSDDDFDIEDNHSNIEEHISTSSPDSPIDHTETNFNNKFKASNQEAEDNDEPILQIQKIESFDNNISNDENTQSSTINNKIKFSNNPNTSKNNMTFDDSSFLDFLKQEDFLDSPKPRSAINHNNEPTKLRINQDENESSIPYDIEEDPSQEIAEEISIDDEEKNLEEEIAEETNMEREHSEGKDDLNSKMKEKKNDLLYRGSHNNKEEMSLESQRNLIDQLPKFEEESISDDEGSHIIRNLNIEEEDIIDYQTSKTEEDNISEDERISPHQIQKNEEESIGEDKENSPHKNHISTLIEDDSEEEEIPINQSVVIEEEHNTDKENIIKEEFNPEEESNINEEPNTEEEHNTEDEPNAEEESNIDEEPNAEEEHNTEEEPNAEEESNIDEEPNAEEESNIDEEPNAEEESNKEEEHNTYKKNIIEEDTAEEELNIEEESHTEEENNIDEESILENDISLIQKAALNMQSESEEDMIENKLHEEANLAKTIDLDKDIISSSNTDDIKSLNRFSTELNEEESTFSPIENDSSKQDKEYSNSEGLNYELERKISSNGTDDIISDDEEDSKDSITNTSTISDDENFLKRLQKFKDDNHFKENNSFKVDSDEDDEEFLKKIDDLKKNDFKPPSKLNSSINSQNDQENIKENNLNDDAESSSENFDTNTDLLRVQKKIMDMKFTDESGDNLDINSSSFKINSSSDGDIDFENEDNIDDDNISQEIEEFLQRKESDSDENDDLV